MKDEATIKPHNGKIMQFSRSSRFAYSKFKLCSCNSRNWTRFLEASNLWRTIAFCSFKSRSFFEMTSYFFLRLLIFLLTFCLFRCSFFSSLYFFDFSSFFSEQFLLLLLFSKFFRLKALNATALESMSLKYCWYSNSLDFGTLPKQDSSSEPSFFELGCLEKEAWLADQRPAARLVLL